MEGCESQGTVTEIVERDTHTARPDRVDAFCHPLVKDRLGLAFDLERGWIEHGVVDGASDVLADCRRQTLGHGIHGIVFESPAAYAPIWRLAAGGPEDPAQTMPL